MRRDPEAVRDLLVRQGLTDQLRDFHLPDGQFVPAEHRMPLILASGRSAGHMYMTSLQKTVDQGRRQMRLTQHDHNHTWAP